MSDKKPTKHLLVTVPPDVTAWLERQAERNCSSQSSEVVRSVRERMDREERV